MNSFQYPSCFSIFALRCLSLALIRLLNRSNADRSFFMMNLAIFLLYLSIWFVSNTLNRLWWAVFRWRLYPMRSRFARDLWTWLALGATTWCTVCFFWIRHPSDIVISKKMNFILQIFRFFKIFEFFLFLFFGYDLSCLSSFYTQTLRNCWKWHNSHNHRVTNVWWIRFIFKGLFIVESLDLSDT